MMDYYRINKQCGVCNREFIIDMSSIGTPHQNVVAVTCKECSEKVLNKND